MRFFLQRTSATMDVMQDGLAFFVAIETHMMYAPACAARIKIASPLESRKIGVFY
jgi:hypothetical protein